MIIDNSQTRSHSQTLKLIHHRFHTQNDICRNDFAATKFTKVATGHLHQPPNACALSVQHFDESL